jgi:ribosome-associated toxin RatA of RatAB toxin-antitoxin module
MDNRISFSLDEADKQEILAALKVLKKRLKQRFPGRNKAKKEE